jgi:hypothetical protein
MIIARATATSRYDFDPREEFIVANVGTGASTLKERLAGDDCLWFIEDPRFFL